MASRKQDHRWVFEINLWATIAAYALALLMIILATQLHAQTFTVLHTFTGGQDGKSPYAGVTLDQAGSLYGTTTAGGAGYGTVYKLTHKGPAWTFNPLFSFDGSDGANPEARVIFGPNGTLYGTTEGGGLNNCNTGCGTVFNLRPSATACRAALCPWTETVLYAFKGHFSDGAAPGAGDLLFDQAGNIYGATSGGGGYDYGAVYELTPSGGGWTESILYSFPGGVGGFYPFSGVIFDNAGNLYGTTVDGGLANRGTVFELTYSAGSGWTESILYDFPNGSDGSGPQPGLIFDPLGNLYGATPRGGKGGAGTVFKLTPAGNGNWMYSLVYSFTGGDPCGPWGTLVMDEAGNLYGTTYCGGFGYGRVFELTPSSGGWAYKDLYDFTGGSDGAHPYGSVVFDASGNLYGTTYTGGSQGDGVVWEITP